MAIYEYPLLPDVVCWGGYFAGRAILGVFYLWSALGFFYKLNENAQISPFTRERYSSATAIVMGFLFAFGGISILLGFVPELGLTAVTTALLVRNFKEFSFWSMDDPHNKLIARSEFMKNLALAGSTLVFGLIAVPWAYSIEKFSA